MGKLIEIKDLVVNFYTYEGVVKALNKVNLSIDHGITFGLVGESGCGKSVTARAIMRIVQEPGQIEAGRIRLYKNQDQPPTAVELLNQTEQYMENLRGNMISMIFQEPNAALNPIMTIGKQVSESYIFHQKGALYREVLSELSSRDNRVALPLRMLLKPLYAVASRNGRSRMLPIFGRLPLLKHWDRRMRRRVIERVITLLGQLGIAEPEKIVNAYPHNLSGGMKQRIVIAMALASNPLLLIADEATSNLDVTIQAQILELLKTLRQQTIASILLITHDLGVVAETCDRVGVMYAGNMCEIADVAVLFDTPLHPYTRALLNSVPKLNQKGRLSSIDGHVPNLVDPPSGCRFHPRCEHALPVCREQLPEMVEIGKQHVVACHQYKNKSQDDIRFQGKRARSVDSQR